MKRCCRHRVDHFWPFFEMLTLLSSDARAWSQSSRKAGPGVVQLFVGWLCQHELCYTLNNVCGWWLGLHQGLCLEREFTCTAHLPRCTVQNGHSSVGPCCTWSITWESDNPPMCMVSHIYKHALLHSCTVLTCLPACLTNLQYSFRHLTWIWGLSHAVPNRVWLDDNPSLRSTRWG